MCDYDMVLIKSGKRLLIYTQVDAWFAIYQLGQLVPSSSPLCNEDAIHTFIPESSAFRDLILLDVPLDTWNLFTTARKANTKWILISSCGKEHKQST